MMLKDRTLMFDAVAGVEHIQKRIPFRSFREYLAWGRPGSFRNLRNWSKSRGARMTPSRDWLRLQMRLEPAVTLSDLYRAGHRAFWRKTPTRCFSLTYLSISQRSRC